MTSSMMAYATHLGPGVEMAENPSVPPTDVTKQPTP
jgi:hypothetical protein